MESEVTSNENAPKDGASPEISESKIESPEPFTINVDPAHDLGGREMAAIAPQRDGDSQDK